MKIGSDILIHGFVLTSPDMTFDIFRVFDNIRTPLCMEGTLKRYTLFLSISPDNVFHILASPGQAWLGRIVWSMRLGHVFVI